MAARFTNDGEGSKWHQQGIYIYFLIKIWSRLIPPLFELIQTPYFLITQSYIKMEYQYGLKINECIQKILPSKPPSVLERSTR